MSENFEQLFNNHFIQQPFYPGALVKAKILDIGKDYVLVDANLKSESLIPVEQFINPQGDLEIDTGSEVEVAIEALEDSLGETRLSRIEAKRITAWSDLQEAYDKKESVYGTITKKVKGGFTVDMHILQGFLPGSLMDPQLFRDANILENAQPLEFKITKLDPRRNNIVLSRRAAALELETGQIVEGYVKPNLENYGAFIDLGGVDGLLHNTDISWKKIKHPSEVLTPSTGPDDKIKVMILSINRTSDRPRISLGLKQLGPDPWTEIAERYAIGQRLDKRKVTHIKEYGCFVEIEPGIEGLVHTTAMEWTNRNPNPYAVVQQEQDEEGRIDVVILDMDIDLEKNKRRISLGIKQTKENPWKSFADNHREGEYVTGKIRSITDLGLFINLEGNLDGLVHHSTISDNFSENGTMEQFKKGSEIEVEILSIDPIKERIALSISDRKNTQDKNNQNVYTPDEAPPSRIDVSNIEDLEEQVTATVSTENTIQDSNSLSDESIADSAEELITTSLQEISESDSEEDPLLSNAQEFDQEDKDSEPSSNVEDDATSEASK